jgi:hypothetical protein
MGANVAGGAAVDADMDRGMIPRPNRWGGSVYMRPVLLFRTDRDSETELEAARRHWPVELDRGRCRDQLVVGRYSVLPFYEALEEDLAGRGCRLVNTYAQHRWIANFEYYAAFRDVTPESWSEDEFASAPDGPFVLKGRSSSFKHHWSDLMFARDKADALRKADVLRQRQVIAQQGLLFRRFVPLETFEHTASGLPVSNEWRFFFLGERLIGYGYYWARLARTQPPAISADGVAFARSCAARVAGAARFFVVDVARTAAGAWVLIELNDAQTSGLAAIDPDEFYRELWAACDVGGSAVL